MVIWRPRSDVAQRLLGNDTPCPWSFGTIVHRWQPFCNVAAKLPGDIHIWLNDDLTVMSPKGHLVMSPHCPWQHCSVIAKMLPGSNFHMPGYFELWLRWQPHHIVIRRICSDISKIWERRKNVSARLQCCRHKTSHWECESCWHHYTPSHQKYCRDHSVTAWVSCWHYYTNSRRIPCWDLCTIEWAHCWNLPSNTPGNYSETK